MVSTERDSVFALMERSPNPIPPSSPSLDFSKSTNVIQSYIDTFTDDAYFEFNMLPKLPRKAYLLPAHSKILQKVNRSMDNIRKYNDIIMLAADKYNISPNLLRAVLIQESDGIWYARSPVGALGIAQFMPGTWSDVNKGVNKAMNYTNPLNPYQAIHASAQYLRDQLGPCKGNKDAALASYNQGGGSVRQKQGTKNFDGKWRIRSWPKRADGGTKETLNYVASIRIIEQYLDDKLSPLYSGAEWNGNNYSWTATGNDAIKLQKAKDKEPFIDKKNMGGEGRDIDDYLNDQDFIRHNPQFVGNIKNLTPREIEVIEPEHPEIREIAEALGNTQTRVKISEDQSTKQKQKEFTVSDFGKEVLKRAGMSAEQIAALTDYAELKGDVLKKHNELIKTGISNKEKRINANKEKKKGDPLEPVTKEEQYLRLFPGKRDNTGYSEDDVEIFKWLQEAHSQSDPTKPVSQNKDPEGKVLKNAIRVAIAVPKRLMQMNPNEAKEQIEKAQKFLDRVDGGENLVVEIVHIDDDRSNGKVQILPMNTKGQAMFSHHDGVKGASMDSALNIGALALFGGPPTMIAAAAGGALSMLDNYAYNHNWWGISDKYQIPITIDHAFQQSLHDSEFDYDNANDVYDMFNKIEPGTEIGHRTSKWGWGTKHYVGETTLKSIKEMTGQSTSLERDMKERFEKSDNPPPPKQQTPATDTQKQKEPTQEDIQQQQRIREQEEKDRKKREEENDERLTKMFYAMLKFR